MLFRSRRAAKVFVRFAVRFAAAQQHAVGAGWALDRELIERQAATAGAFDARACSVGKAQRSNSHSGNGARARVVDDFTNNNRDFVSRFSFHKLGEFRRGDGWAVQFSHAKAFVHSVVEFGRRTTGQKCVQLDQQAQIRILRFGCFSHGAFAATIGDVNTHGCEKM